MNDIELLQNENRLLRELLGLTRGNLYWKDANGVYQGANNHLAKIHHFKNRDEIIGKTDYDMLDAAEAEKIRKTDQEIMKSGQELVLEESGFAIDGSFATYLTSKIPVKNENGEAIGILGISIDISAQKEAEKKLQEEVVEKAQFEERIRTMRVFAGGIAHELRTPLSAMVSAAAGIRKFMPRLVDTYNMAKEANLDVPFIRQDQLIVLKDTAEHIMQEGEYSLSVITMTLVAAQTAEIDDQKFTLLPMVATIQTALTTFYYQDANDKALVHFKPENDFQFWGDTTFMMNIIFNLVKNALFFIHKARKGEITIWLENQKDKNMVYVKDTSVGIPKENLPRIFEGYFTTRETGTGVGLALVRRVMKAFKGDITCESVEGEYTTFAMTFPILKN